MLNELTELRLLVDEVVNKTNMWRSKASTSNDVTVVVSDQEPKSFILLDPIPVKDAVTVSYVSNKKIKLKDKERLSKYLALEKNSLSPFEAEVVKLTISNEPLDFICSELNRTKKIVQTALNSALNKAIREEEIKKSESVMAFFVGDPVKKEFHVH